MSLSRIYGKVERNCDDKEWIRMSFTIKCDKCGNEIKLHNGDSRNNDKIQLIADVGTDWIGRYEEVRSVDIYCENKECQNTIEIK
jgi:hypothetical protein